MTAAPLLTRNACIYANRSVRPWLKARVLKRIPELWNPRDDGFWFLPPHKLTFEVAGVGVTLNARYHSEDEKPFEEHIRGFKGWCSAIHAKTPDFDLDFFHRYLDQVSQSYGVVAEQEFTLDSDVMKALLKVSESLGGYLFVHSSVLHPSGDVMFGLLAELHRAGDNPDS